MVTINNKIDPYSSLYHEGKFIGTIRNSTALLDVCAQIKTLGEEGYTIKFKGRHYPITKSGKISNPPSNFYDSSNKSLRVIFGIQ